MTRSPEPTLDVVCPVRNGADHLPRLLAALAAQTVAPQRIVVVDDGSTDGTPALLDSWQAGQPGRVVLRTSGVGPAAARNAGLAATTSEWVAFTDADTVPDTRWLEALLARTDGADGVEGRVVSVDERTRLRADAHRLENEHGGRYVTANMAYRRELLQRLGGFDESFTDAFLEDSDLAFRVLDAGGRIVFAPEAVVGHPVHASTPFGSVRAARKLRWLPLLAAKHPDRYRAQIHPHLRPVTRPDGQVLAGLAGAVLLAFGGVPRVAGAVLAANAVRVIALSPRVRVPARELPEAAAAGVALPVAKAGWWLAGWLRWGRWRG